MSWLTSGFWVDAYLHRLALAGIPAFIVNKGDETAGAVLVKASLLNGRAVAYQRIPDAELGRKWDILDEGPEAQIDASIQKQRRFDPDLWVIEVEDRLGRTLLDEDGLFG